MSSLVAVAYPDLRTAEQARRAMTRLTVERVLEIEDAVIVIRGPNGVLRLHAAAPAELHGGTAAAVSGGLIGIVMLGPALGANGVEEHFIRQLGATLESGSAALLVLVRRSTPETLLPLLSDFGGSAFHTGLSTSAEERLKAALEA
jgi:uncharacterized membrane protein